jgi:hypothetical protein
VAACLGRGLDTGRVSRGVVPLVAGAAGCAALNGAVSQTTPDEPLCAPCPVSSTVGGRSAAHAGPAAKPANPTTASVANARCIKQKRGFFFCVFLCMVTHPVPANRSKYIACAG